MTEQTEEVTEAISALGLDGWLTAVDALRVAVPRQFADGASGTARNGGCPPLPPRRSSPLLRSARPNGNPHAWPSANPAS